MVKKGKKEDFFQSGHHYHRFIYTKSPIWRSRQVAKMGVLIHRAEHICYSSTSTTTTTTTKSSSSLPSSFQSSFLLPSTLPSRAAPNLRLPKTAKSAHFAGSIILASGPAVLLIQSRAKKGEGRRSLLQHRGEGEGLRVFPGSLGCLSLLLVDLASAVFVCVQCSAGTSQQSHQYLRGTSRLFGPDYERTGVSYKFSEHTAAPAH